MPASSRSPALLEAVTKLVPSAEADSLFPTYDLPALTCRAFIYRHFAAGAHSVPPLGCDPEFRNRLSTSGTRDLPRAMALCLGRSLAPRLRRPRLKPAVYREAASLGMTPRRGKCGRAAKRQADRVGGLVSFVQEAGREVVRRRIFAGAGVPEWLSLPLTGMRDRRAILLPRKKRAVTGCSHVPQKRRDVGHPSSHVAPRSPSTSLRPGSRSPKEGGLG